MTDNPNYIEIGKIKFNKAELIIFILCLIINFIARGPAFYSISYSIDDYQIINQKVSFPGIHQGRFCQAILYEFLNLIGMRTASPFFVFISLIFYLYAGIIICRLWKISDNIFISCIVILFMTLHPYQAEIYTFKFGGCFYYSLSIFLCFHLFYYNQINYKNILLGCLYIFLALGINQIVVNYIFLVICLYLVVEISRLNEIKNYLNLKQKIFNIKTFYIIITTFISILFYLIINKLIIFATLVKPEIRLNFISINGNEIIKRILQIKELLIYIFFKSEPIIPIFTKILMLILLILAVFITIINIIPKKDNNVKFMAGIIMLLLLIISIPMNFIVLLPIKEWWPVPRVLSSIGIFWSCILVLAYFNCNKTWLKGIIITLAIIVLLSFIGLNNQIFIDQARVNMRDINKANRIIVELEKKPDFKKIKKLAIIGGYWGYSMPINTLQGDMNMSAFGCSWSKLSLINEISGYNFTSPTEEEYKKAEEYYRKSPKWPEPNSIIVDGEVGIICLP